MATDEPAKRDEAAEKMLHVLEQILEAMQKSNTSQAASEDVPSKFWAEYHRVANEHDTELIERHGSNIEGLLIFAGLFSAVSSAFIIAMQPLNSGPTSILSTNDLLRLLVIHSINNTTGFPDILPGSGSTTPPNAPPGSIWIQSLAYAGLFASLLAAFGAVLAKQWLAHFKSSRWGRGSLEDRCRRRQAKFDGLQNWYFDAVLDTLPTLLHISFLLFGIALGANVWLQSHTVAAVIFGATALAGGFYVCTSFAYILSADCPYRTPMAAAFRAIPRVSPPVERIIVEGFYQAKLLYHKTRKYGSRMLEVLKGAPALQKILSVRPRTYAPSLPLVDEMDLDVLNKSAIGRARKGLAIFKLGLPDTSVDASAPSTIRWILETSTDPNTITTAALMIPELEWPLGYNVSAACVQLKNMMPRTLDFGPDLPEDHVYRICARAIVRLECIADPGHAAVSSKIWNVAFSDYIFDHTPFSSSAQWRNSLMEAASVLPFILDQPDADSDSTWGLVAIDVISKLLPMRDLTERVLTDCLLCVNILFGVRIVHRDLVKRDKSPAKADLAESVILLFQEVLLNMTWDTPDHLSGIQNPAGVVLLLLVPLSHLPSNKNLRKHRVADIDFLLWILRLCFYILRVGPPWASDKALTALPMSLSRGYTEACDGSQVCPWVDYKGLNLTHTEASFVVDHLDALLRHSESDHDYAVITAAFLILRHGGAIEDSQKRMSYFNAIVHCMQQDKPAHVRFRALRAACFAADNLVLVDDRIFQSRFLTVLYEVSSLDHRPPEWNTNESTFPYLDRDQCYIRLLNVLVGKLSWRENLGSTGHFPRCLTIVQDIFSLPDLSGWQWSEVCHVTDAVNIFATAKIGVADASSSHAMLEIDISDEDCRTLAIRAWDVVFSQFCSSHFSSIEEKYRLQYYDDLRPVIRYSMQCHWPRDIDLHTLKDKIQMTLDAFRNDLRQGYKSPLAIVYKPDPDAVRTVIKELEELITLIESATDTEPAGQL